MPADKPRLGETPEHKPKVETTGQPQTFTPWQAVRKAFSLPTDEELQELDACSVVCRECMAEWEVVLLHHTFTRGTVNALLAHAQSHQPNRPGLRRIS